MKANSVLFFSIALQCSREKLPKHYKSDIINHVKLIYDVAMQNKERLDKHDADLAEHVNMNKDVDRRVADLEKIAHNAMIWRIEGFQRKSNEAKGGNLDTLFSPTFTTSKHGYRLCASVCLNGDGKGKGTHLSIFVSVLKGREFRITYICSVSHAAVTMGEGKGGDFRPGALF